MLVVETPDVLVPFGQLERLLERLSGFRLFGGLAALSGVREVNRHDTRYTDDEGE